MTMLIFVPYKMRRLWAERQVGATGVLLSEASRPAVGARACYLMYIGGAFVGG